MINVLEMESQSSCWLQIKSSYNEKLQDWNLRWSTKEMEWDNLPNKQRLRILKRDFQTNDLKLEMYFSNSFLMIGKLDKED